MSCEQGITKEYLHGSFFPSFQKSFTEKREAVNVLLSALNGENVVLDSYLPTLRNGNLGSELRRFVKDGHATHLVGKDVQTVSDFVHALQDKTNENYHNCRSVKKAR